MLLKKSLSAVLAALTVMSAGISAFAAPTTTQVNPIEKFTGDRMLDTGEQVPRATSVEPNQTIYYLIPPETAKYFTDSKSAKVTVKKVKNGKMVKSVKLVERIVTTNRKTVNVPDGGTGSVSYSSASRNTYLAVELHDTNSEDEFRIDLNVIVTAKKAFPVKYAGGATTLVNLAVGDKLEMKLSAYVQNTEHKGDATIYVGTNGKTIKPIKNEDHEIVFEASDTLATLTFEANSNPGSFYAKLSTKWDSATLAKFKNTDAVIRKFSAATIPATSRATLKINNPFGDDVSYKNVYIYEVSANGVIKDVSANWRYNSDEDVYYCKTRTLGTWIISDRKVKV